MGSVYTILDEKYLSKGLKIFPVMKNGKRPLIENWQNDCSSSPLQVSYWVNNAENCNWGLPCTPNNLFVIDIDVHGVNGIESMKKLLKDIGLDGIPKTLGQKTPSGGIHLIFKSDDELKTVANTSNSFKDYPGIDIRTDGYIVCYPSTIDNNQYVLNNNGEPLEMPQKLKEFILSQKEIVRTEKKEKKEYEKPESVDEGGRDTALFEYINNLYFKTRLDEDEILCLAKDFNTNKFNPPLPDREVKYKVRKAFKKDRGLCMFIWLNDDIEDE